MNGYRLVLGAIKTLINFLYGVLWSFTRVTGVLLGFISASNIEIKMEMEKSDKWEVIEAQCLNAIKESCNYLAISKHCREMLIHVMSK